MARLSAYGSYITPVVYRGEIKDKVDAYDNLPLKIKAGNFWDSTEDGEMADVKKVIKDHYKLAQDYTCPYCLQRVEVDHNGAWDAEHIIPKDTHPQFMFEPRNLCISCKDCNLIKLNRNVLKNKKRIRFPNRPEDYAFCHPHFHIYAEHITVIEKAGFYLPRTKEGIQLVEICGLLRFVLKYAECEWTDEELCMQIRDLGEELFNEPLAESKVLIMSMMKTLLDDGLRKAALSRINARVLRREVA